MPAILGASSDGLFYSDPGVSGASSYVPSSPGCCRVLQIALEVSDLCLRNDLPRPSSFTSTENGVPPSGNTRVVRRSCQSVAGRAPGVVRSKWRE